MTGGYVKTDVIDGDTSHTPEEGAHSPSWPNRLIIFIFIVIILNLIYNKLITQRAYNIREAIARSDDQNLQMLDQRGGGESHHEGLVGVASEVKAPPCSRKQYCSITRLVRGFRVRGFRC